MQADAARAGQRFCLLHEPREGATRGAIVFVHAFAEEMNKSRRMAAMQARTLADAGYCVLQIDLHGCGDSSGDFGDASWQGWVEDIAQAARWLQNHTNAPLWMWGHRCGCLLAAEAAGQFRLECNFLFWAPPASGKPLLQQFLRLKTASHMLTGAASAGMEALRTQLVDEGFVEVAGYRLPSALANGLEQSTLTPPGQPGARVEWLELSSRESATLSPVSTKASMAWQSAGYTVRCQVVQGPTFWQTTEIEEVPALIEATLAAVTGDVHAVAH